MCVCLKAAAQFSGDTEVDEATVGPVINPEEQEIGNKKILDNQYKCFEKMNRDAPYNKSGSESIYGGSWCLCVRTSSSVDVKFSPLLCRRRRAALQSELGRLAVLGGHSGRDVHLSELPKLFP